ncbi:MAG: histidine kinase dimerization/phosphoacceptor domain -containing protein, partial [Spirochaetota bacterium]
IFQHKIATGEVRTVEVYNGPILIKSKTLIYSIIHDITDMKEMSRRLKKSEARFESLVNSMEDIIYTLDKDQKHTALYGRGIKKYGLSPEHFIGKSARDIYGKEAAKVHEEANEKALNGEYTIYEWYVDTEEGRKYFHTSLSPLYGHNNDIAGIVGIGREITELKRMEIELELNEKRLNALYKLSQMTDSTLDEMRNYVLEESIKLTQSTIGFLGTINEKKDYFEIYNWSKTVMKECQLTDKPVYFPIKEAGIWADSVRQKKPIIINDYENYTHKKGYPKGHIKIKRLITIPIVYQGDIVGVSAVANKKSDYNETDVTQMQLLINGMYNISRKIMYDKQLKESLKEKEVLLKEIHHRVKNNFQIIISLLNLQSQYIKCQGDKELFRDSENRIRTMALIHESLYQSSDFSKVNFRKYLNELIDQLLYSYNINKARLNLNLKIEDLSFGVDVAIPLAQIISELFTNCIKHAFNENEETKINIELSSKNGKNILIVSDKGQGLSEDINVENAGTLGFQLVSALTTQLDANINIDRKGGTKFIIEF